MGSLVEFQFQMPIHPAMSLVDDLIDLSQSLSLVT